MNGTQKCNPGLVLKGVQPVLDGSSLASSVARMQLYFIVSDCGLGTQHLHMSSPNGMRRPENLGCQLCPEFMATRVGYETEKQVLEQMRQAEKDIIKCMRSILGGVSMAP